MRLSHRTQRRRDFLAAGAAIGATRAFAKAADVDAVLHSAARQRGIPAVAAMAAGPDTILYSGAFGLRDRSGEPVRIDSIFQIASMTKAITTVAALQMVEQGKVSLDEPVHSHLPRLAALDVLEGFDAAGKPRLRPARTAITLRHLLTHTSGLCYPYWDEQAFLYGKAVPPSPAARPGPLMFEPGTRWQYGQGVDWAGRLVEKLSAMTLEDYFQEKIFRPLGMTDTSYILPEAKFDRLVTNHRRDATGRLVPDERKPPPRPTEFNGGGGLYSTAGDYIRFLQMLLRHGAGPGPARAHLLRPETVRAMATNQIGALSAGKMKSFFPNASADVDLQPGHTQKWGLGFLINPAAYPGGRSAGSLAWAGFYNTYYWIDPARRRCAVVLMQFHPFADPEAVGLLGDFERAVYRAL